jgi:8-oxo-dGTP pyrophosphatase MutT (NUDIX family)
MGGAASHRSGAASYRTAGRSAWGAQTIRYAPWVADETTLDETTTGEAMLNEAPPRYRPTSRLLVLDPWDRILLLLIEDPKLDVPRLWITPGGGVEPGETFEAGARRELWEETGIVAPLGPCVWKRRRIVTFDGRVYDFDERYYVVRVESDRVDPGSRTSWELEVLTEHRWWTLEELQETDEVLAPRRLAELIVPILAGSYSPEPLVLHGW